MYIIYNLETYIANVILKTLPLGNITSLKANVYNIGKIHQILETKKWIGNIESRLKTENSLDTNFEILSQT